MKKLLFGLLLSLCLIAAQAQAADYTNSIGMEFVTIPAGSFYMGSCKMSAADKEANKKREFMGLSPRYDASDDETPQHKVKISRSFQLGKYEVTLGQFKKFIIASGRDDLLTDDFMKYNNHGDRAAVCMVSWKDAQAFIRWLNNPLGLSLCTSAWNQSSNVYQRRANSPSGCLRPWRPEYDCDSIKSAYGENR